MTLTSNHMRLHLGRFGLLAIARRHPVLFARLLGRLG